ncbi:MAG: GPR endopeptidase [Lachnotalea sp.]
MVKSSVDKFMIRTDLAVEAKESFEEDNVEIRGVIIDEKYKEDKDIKITRVIIETKNGAKAMGKPMGTYITLEAPNMIVPDEDYHREISKELAEQIKSLIPLDDEISILIVGLGNRQVTPDSLGPNVVENLLITRHVVKEYGKAAFNKSKVNLISGIVPGVMAQTGMETLEIVKGVVNETKPDYVIAIDALAARSTKRLNRTIQITDTGINPGSGVGNHREGLNFDSLHVPVIAIGIPTVVDAATIVNDTMENLIDTMEQTKQLKEMGGALKTFDSNEKYQLIKEIISPHLNGMYVTPKDIDEMVKMLGFTISEGLNMAFS